MRKVVKTAYCDPDNSVDLFDGDRVNEFGHIFCVAPAILRSEVDSIWKRYVLRRKLETRNVCTPNNMGGI